jgi:predicted ATPase
VWIYRDNELTPDHALTTAIANLKRSVQNLNTLTIGSLNEIEVVDLVASSLRCTHAEAGPLGRLIHTKTQGNLFFTLHFFKGLYHKSLLWFNWDTNKWCWNTDHIQWMENTDNVIDFLVASLKRTPPYVIAVLHPAACMGHIFNMDIIRMLPSCKSMQPQQVDHALQIALHQGFITHVRVSNELTLSDTNVSEKTFRFTHDRVQQAVYNLLPSHPTHLEIGHVMLSLAVHQPKLDDISNIKILSESDLFSAMDHINHSVDIIASSEFDDIERQRICVLNLRAGTIAKSSGAHESALKYINCGISLLPSGCWTGPLYNVALELHLLSAECEYMCNNAEWATAVFETVLHFARSDLDKAAAFSLRMAVNTADSHFDEAIDAGCRACNLLGWDVDTSSDSMLSVQMLIEIDKLLCHLAQSSSGSPPNSPSFVNLTMPRPPLPTIITPISHSEDPRNVQSYFDSDVSEIPPSPSPSPSPSPLPTLGGRWAVAKLAYLPEMIDEKAIELMKVLSVMASFTFMTNPGVFAMCACKMVQLTLQYGNSPHSCLGFIYFAFYQGTFDNFRTAYEFGMTARALSDRYKQDGLAGAAGRTLLCHAGWVAKWGQPFSACGPQLVQAYHDLLAAGDVLCATIAALIKVTHDVWAGESLATLLAEGTRTVEFLQKRCPLKSLSLLGTCSVRFAMAMMGLTQSNTSIDDPDPPLQTSRSPLLSQSGSGQVHFGQTHTLHPPTPTDKNRGPPQPIISTPASPPDQPNNSQPNKFSESAFLESIRTGTGRMRYAHTCWHYVFRLKALYLLECYNEAHTVARDCKQLIHHLSGQTHVILYHFYHALTLVQLIKRSETDVKLRDTFMGEIKESCIVLGKWSESAPFNFAHRYHLVRAEVARISGRTEKAQGLYEQAIMACRTSGFIHQEALAGKTFSHLFQCFSMLIRFNS